MITVFAPGGIGEITPGADLGRLIVDAAGPAGGLRAGDIVVVTSKIISKAEGRAMPAVDRDEAVAAESVATVAWRDGLRIARTRTGLVQAAAGVDSSNVAPGTILPLPVDPDASAARLRADLERRVGGRIGVVVSDTAGRTWRVGQTDHAVGASGVRVLRSYVGGTDSYGNPLRVSITAVADELAAAADLAKGKLEHRPVAVIRGLDDLLDSGDGARALVRGPAEDLFPRGSRESVVGAVLAAVGRPDAYEDLVGLEGDDLVKAVLADCEEDAREVVERILRAALAEAHSDTG